MFLIKVNVISFCKLYVKFTCESIKTTFSHYKTAITTFGDSVKRKVEEAEELELWKMEEPL